MQGVFPQDPVYKPSIVKRLIQCHLDIRDFHYKIFLNTKGWHHGPTGFTGNVLWFPVRDLEEVSCHPLCSLRLFNHLPSWYVEWRTSAIPSRCHMLPPGPSITHPTASDHLTPGGPQCRPELRPSKYLIRMGKEDLTLTALCAGPLPALLHASLLMSVHPPPTPYTHLQIRHSFNSLSLPSRLSQRHTGDANFFPSFLHLLYVLSSVIKAMNKKWKWGLFILSVPWQTVCKEDPNDPGLPLLGGLSPAKAPQSSLGRCSLLLLTANVIHITL